MARAAQKTKESEITEQDSLLLTRNLLRIAIFNISYIRGLFPENYFNDKSVPALGIKIKKLLPIDTDSRRLIDWMEKGVYDALQKKYLKTLLFCICESPEGPMIEEYAFSFTYSSSDNEEVSINVSRKGNKKQGTTFKTNSAEVTPDQMRSSACKMIRTLLQLMRTLDEIPEERTILMKLHYYEDVTPEDYEPPFFRSCSESESNNAWTRDPFKTEVGNVNSKHLVLALKVKSVLDPCGDENDGTPDGAGINLEEEAVQHDDMSSDSEIDLSRENRYILAPTGGRGKVEDNSTVNEDNTQDAELEEESTAQIRNWISSRHIDTVDLVDILTNFPSISVALTEEIVGNLMKEGLLSNIGTDSYKINIEKCLNSSVKEEVDMAIDLQTGKGLPNNSQAERVDKNEKYNYLYMKALYHVLPLEYVSITKLQSKLEGEANQATVRKLIEKMIEDGYIDSTPNRKLGKRVVHSEFTNNKLMEVKRALERNSMEIDGRSSEFKGVSIDPSGSNIRNGSTFGGLHSMGSDLTRTRVQSDIPHNASVRSGQTSLTKMQEKGNTPVSKPEPVSSLESGVNRIGKERITDKIPREAEVNVYRRSDQDKRIKKVATVEEPIQYGKRQKLG